MYVCIKPSYITVVSLGCYLQMTHLITDMNMDPGMNVFVYYKYPSVWYHLEIAAKVAAHWKWAEFALRHGSWFLSYKSVEIHRHSAGLVVKKVSTITVRTVPKPLRTNNHATWATGTKALQPAKQKNANGELTENFNATVNKEILLSHFID